MKPIIEIRNIGKKYKIGMHRGYLSLRDQLSSKARHALRSLTRGDNVSDKLNDEFWALRDVSFNVNEGETIGIIGRNGAGKSTLLKILSKITPPTTGKITLRGRVASLLEVGTGFHPELTGRENIYLNGTILGMTRAEINKKFDEIVAFSEIEKFLDTPVKRYSSGMYVRLAFAVAAHLEPEILLVDEVLAVGDAEFQKKCLGKMGDVAQEGRTVLFVSHNMGAIRHLCPSTIFLNNGELILKDDVDSVVQRYLSSFQEIRPQYSGPSIAHHELSGIDLEGITFMNSSDEIANTVETGSPVTICISIKTKKAYNNCLFAIAVDTLDDIRVCAFHNGIAGSAISIDPPGRMIRCRVNNLNLFPGMYKLSFKMRIQDETIFYLPKSLSFSVENSNIYQTGNIPDKSWGGICLLEQLWEAVPLQPERLP
jgi:lipopolysaccharide transport system ATP-binding protein